VKYIKVYVIPFLHPELIILHLYMNLPNHIQRNINLCLMIP